MPGRCPTVRVSSATLTELDTGLVTGSSLSTAAEVRTKFITECSTRCTLLCEDFKRTKEVVERTVSKSNPFYFR